MPIDVEEINSLLRSENIATPISLKIEENVPETVRKLRAARLKRRLLRIEASKGRAGDNHYKRRRFNRREVYHKYGRKSRKAQYMRCFETVEGRYARIKELWARRITADEIADSMSLSEFRLLMRYSPVKVRELRPGIKLDSKHRNVHKHRTLEERYVNQYPNEAGMIFDVMFKIVRDDVTKPYTLDNVLVADQFTKLVYFDGLFDTAAIGRPTA